jgi:hypothetical protein
MFNLLAILVIVLAVGVVPTIATLLFSKTSRDDRESRRELLAIAVEVEKATTSWRARHQHRTANCDDVSTFDAAARRL